jgi:hypothetical protein
MLQLKSLSNQLVELKMAFDAAIMHGDSFADVKKIYIQIKEIEKLIVEREVMLFKSERQPE